MNKSRGINRKRLIPLSVALIVLMAVAFIPGGMGFKTARVIKTDSDTQMIFMDNSPVVIRDETPRKNAFKKYTTGDKIMVITGPVAESFPGGAAMHWCVKLDGGHYTDIPADLLETLYEMGYTVIGETLLADEYAVIDNRLVLAGRLDASPIGGFDGRRRAPLESVLAGAPEGLPVVVMDHNPAGASSYGSGVSLVLSGHTLKGQVFPGGLITGMMYDVDHGHWQKDAAAPHVIVTSGVGTWGMPMRVGTDSEVVTIRLHR